MQNCNFLAGKSMFAAVVELVDTLVLGTSIARCEGSSPFRGTLSSEY